MCPITSHGDLDLNLLGLEHVSHNITRGLVSQSIEPKSNLIKHADSCPQSIEPKSNPIKHAKLFLYVIYFQDRPIKYNILYTSNVKVTSILKGYKKNMKMTFLAIFLVPQWMTKNKSSYMS
jgi:hypothetical protein